MYLRYSGKESEVQLHIGNYFPQLIYKEAHQYICFFIFDYKSFLDALRNPALLLLFQSTRVNWSKVQVVFSCFKKEEHRSVNLNVMSHWESLGLVCHDPSGLDKVSISNGSKSVLLYSNLSKSIFITFYIKRTFFNLKKYTRLHE